MTTGAEENLLKLKELRGILTPQEAQRWSEIKSEFKIRNSVAGDEDGATKIASQISGIKENLKQLSSQTQIQEITHAIEKLSIDVEVTNNPLPALGDALGSLSETMSNSFVPIVVAMNKKLEINMEVLEEVTKLSKQLDELSSKKSVKTRVKATSKKTTKKTTQRKKS